MNLKESNRWVRKAQTIPWTEIETRCAALFSSRKGNVAKPLRLALGACIIQAEYGFSDEETALMIQENPYLQCFCGYPGYDDEKLPFDPSLMVYFRKRLTPEILGEINEMIIRDAKERQEKENKSNDDADDAQENGGNSGTMIVDAPAHRPISGILRTFLCSMRPEKTLTAQQAERLDTIRTIYEQQKYMYDHRTHSVPDRIVSVSQPFVRPIVRGKAAKPVEFGAKLDISVVAGWTRLEFCSFDAYNEAGNLQAMAERFRKREGHYPSRILADKIYRNRENLRYCREHGIRLSGPALGRPKKGETRDKAQDYRDECERVEVERRFSLAKRKCGMGLVTAKLRETAAHVIAMSVLVLILRRIQCALLWLITYLTACFRSIEKWAIVQ